MESRLKEEAAKYVLKKREVFVRHQNNMENRFRDNQYLRKQSEFVLEKTKCLTLSSVQAEVG